MRRKETNDDLVVRIVGFYMTIHPMASSMNGTFVNIYNYKKKEIKMMVL
jgi:hypothetical protein